MVHRRLQWPDEGVSFSWNWSQEGCEPLDVGAQNRPQSSARAPAFSGTEASLPPLCSFRIVPLCSSEPKVSVPVSAVPSSSWELPQKATAKAASAVVFPTPFYIVLPTVTVEITSEVLQEKNCCRLLLFLRQDLCKSDRSGPCYVDQADLELTGILLPLPSEPSAGIKDVHQCS